MKPETTKRWPTTHHIWAIKRGEKIIAFALTEDEADITACDVGEDARKVPVLVVEVGHART